jgi:hypothetical protein
MFSLTIYSKPYTGLNGKTTYPFLKVSAANNYNYYTPYPYFASHISNKPIYSVDNNFKESTVNEHLTRARRVILFSDITELKPSKYTKKYFKSIADRAHKAGGCDHLSFWLSYWNTKFLLNEPYDVHPDYMMKLAAQDLVAIELHNGISPYCGRWDPTPGAKPWTRSFLICDVHDLDELEALFKELSDASMKLELIPAWNSLEGITHD